jgi:hypothetical protein
MSAEDEASREEARLLRSINNVGKPKQRPRSWNINKQNEEAQGIKELREKVSANSEEVKPPQPEIVNRRQEPEPPRQLTEEEQRKLREEQERQFKLEEERFKKYFQQDKKVHAPQNKQNVPEIEVTPPKISPRPQGPRQPVVLDISGPGVTKGQVATQSQFTIKVKSADPADLKCVTITAKVLMAGTKTEVPCSVLNFEDGTYHVTYTPDIASPHEVQVFINNQLAPGCPFIVPIAEAGPDAYNTEVDYDSLKGQIAGQVIRAIVKPKSVKGKIVPLGYNFLTAKVTHVASNTGVGPVSVLDNKDNTHTLSFRPTQPGQHIISVTLNKDTVSGSPFLFEVLPSS